ncbi:serum response factor-like, partial [Temnothorax curvispinosus]|uniref:Serum response factor-like n=1 Tax=Temnothorax curvispinosus TaxID=300111 RepID=A0A6J1REG3_9HYME
MDNPSGGRDGRYASLSYSMGMIGSDAGTEIYGRPSTSQLAAAAAAAAAASQLGRGGGGATMMSNVGAATPGVGPVQRGIKRSTSDVCYGDDGNNPRQQSLSQGMPGDCVPDNLDESFTNLGQPKKSPPSNGKKTKGRVKIKMEYIDNKLRRYTTFSKRKTGIMKKVCMVCITSANDLTHTARGYRLLPLRPLSTSAISPRSWNVGRVGVAYVPLSLSRVLQVS